MANFEQKTKYSLYCNNCTETRYTAWCADSAGEPTICPICSSADIKDIALEQQINKGVYSGEAEEEYQTTSSTWFERVNALRPDMLLGEKIKVYWYCEVKKYGTANAKAQIVASGIEHDDDVVAACNWNIYMWRPFSGTAIFEASYSEDVTFGLQFCSQTAGQQVGVRRARIWLEELPEGT